MHFTCRYVKRFYIILKWNTPYFVSTATRGLPETFVMYVIEKTMRLPGIFEWHENQMLTVKFLRLQNDQSPLSWHTWTLLDKWSIGRHRILFSHYIHRLLGYFTFDTFRNAIQFLFVDRCPCANSSQLQAGLHPWNHPLGHGLAIAGLAGHFAYGRALSLSFQAFI